MANSNNARDKKEHFNIVSDIMNDKMKLALAIGIIALLIVAVYLFLQHQKRQSGAGLMELLSDTSPMVPLTATPAA